MTLFLKQIRQKLQEKGQSLVETALMAPILIMMFIGLFEVGYALWGYMTLLNIDREATRFAIRAGALDFNETTNSKIGYSNVITHTLVSNATQLELEDYLFNSAADDPKAAIIITHMIIDTRQPCDNPPNCYQTCDPANPGYTDYPQDDMVLQPDMPGYEYLRYVYPTTSTIASRLDTAALAQQLKTENDRFNCQLKGKAAAADWSKNSAIIVEMFYEQPQMLGFPLFKWIGDPIPLYVQTTMRIDSDDLARCELLPVAMRDTTLNGWVEGSAQQRDIWNGGNASDRGWLSWNGDSDTSYLITELKEPRLATNDYVDPTDPGDTDLNAGDWIASAGGNHAGAQSTLDPLIGQTYVVPVWDQFAGPPANPTRYRVKQFALVQLTGACLSSGGGCGYINARLLDANVDYACPGNGF